MYPRREKTINYGCTLGEPPKYSVAQNRPQRAKKARKTVSWNHSN